MTYRGARSSRFTGAGGGVQVGNAAAEGSLAIRMPSYSMTPVEGMLGPGGGPSGAAGAVLSASSSSTSRTSPVVGTAERSLSAASACDPTVSTPSLVMTLAGSSGCSKREVSARTSSRLLELAFSTSPTDRAHGSAASENASRFFDPVFSDSMTSTRLSVVTATTSARTVSPPLRLMASTKSFMEPPPYDSLIDDSPTVKV